MRSPANRLAPTPKGTAHISDRRLVLTKLSNSRSVRSRTAQIAGYSVPETIASTRSENCEMLAASATAPAAASPRWRVVPSMAAWIISTPAPLATNRGHENDA